MHCNGSEPRCSDEILPDKQPLAVAAVECHPSFEVVDGAIEAWERVTASL